MNNNLLVSSLYDITLTEEERLQAINEHKALSDEKLQEFELDKIEQGISWFAGVLAGGMDMFYVTDIRNLKKGSIGLKDPKMHLQDSGKINNFIDARIKNIYSPKEIEDLENKYWVPYDLSTNANDGVEKTNVLGLNPKVHRQMSLGHDPILGFFYGVRDIMHNTFTIIDNSGATQRIKRVTDKCRDSVGIFEAIGIQIGHLRSDLCTPAGLPIPFFGLLQKLNGTSPIDGMSYNRLVKNMYMKGYNLNHLITMGVPGMFIEVVNRLLFFCYNLYKGKDFMESLPVNNEKIDKMMLQSYAIATAFNAGKLVVSHGNIFAFNPVLWKQTVIYGLKDLYNDYKCTAENERHKYVMEIYNQREEEVVKEIQRLESFYK